MDHQKMTCCTFIFIVFYNKFNDDFPHSLTMVEASAGNTTEENSSISSNPILLVAISKNMQAVKLCSNKILQF